MKQSNNCYLFTFLCFIVFGCVNVNQDPLAHFTEQQTIKIKPSIVVELEDYEILRPLEALKYGDEYVISDQKRNDVVTFVNFSTSKYVSGIGFGNGPNELIMYNGIKIINDRLFLYDMSNKKIFEIINRNDSLQIEQYIEIKYKKKLAIIDILDNKVIASGLSDDFWIEYVDIINNELLSGIDFPKFDNTGSLRGMQKSVIYLSSHLAISPDSKKFVAATQYAGVISLCEIDKDKITDYRQIKYFPPDFSVVQGGNIAFSRKGKIGFCKVDCDNHHIYALYSGRTSLSHDATSHYCEHLLVYDWEGNPVKHYKLDVPMWSMRYDREKNSIYGTAYNPEGVFIEYQL